VTYRLLGSLEVRSNGRAVDLGPRKQRALLAVLLLHAGEIVATDRLIELVWGDVAPRTAAHSVQIYVSGLRRALEPIAGEIVTRPPGYELQVDPDLVDAIRFQRLVTSDDPDTLREALGLWRGAPLSDFAYEDFAQEPIRRFQELRLNAFETLAALELARGRAQEAVSIVESAIPDDPHRERLRELQMVALYRCGRHPDALRAYQRFHRLLDDELGLEPSPSLQRLNERVLLHDPSLAVQTTAPATTVRNPYKGLRAFAEEDAGDFFGRERLVTEIVSALDGGARLVALVGPSGCGKSSVLRAGLIPTLGATWEITTMVPGTDPLEQLERALAEPDRLLLAIDQFEELFTLADDDTAAAFLHRLTDARATVVLTLRADFYDRPLLHGEFAALFTAGVINVLPMAADEIEAAVVGPARRVGVDVDPALLAELVADTTDQRGALPLLQYALTELFEHRTGQALELREYREVGGLRALLSRRSEECYRALDDQQREVALQVFLRLVTLSDEARPSRRRAVLHEFTALDPVALSAVLDEFGRHRLLSFDRDRVTGEAVVEVAHEALLWEWERLAGWCDTYRDDLRRHRSLAAMAAEWDSTDRHPDYLITGGRLEEFEAWSERTTLRLSAIERAFLDSALERRRAELAGEEARRRLERRAARRLWALAAAVVVLVGAAGIGVMSWLESRPPEVSLVWYGGDNDFDYWLGKGFDRAVAALGIDAERRAISPQNLEAELRREAERGVEFVVMTGPPGHNEALEVVAREHPETRFVTFDFLPGERDNVTYMKFGDHETSFLAGVAAALKTRTGAIGFIGGTDFPEAWRFHAGYEAGARAVDPDIRVRAIYLSRHPDYSGYESFAYGRREAARMYRSGSDVIYHHAGVSGYGVIDAAFDLSRPLGRHLWEIGTVNDQYRAMSLLSPDTWGTSRKAGRNVLTSAVKRIDRAVYTALADYQRGTLSPGLHELGLEEGGVELSTSGGFIEDIQSELDRFRERIVSGEIEVPTVPVSRRKGS
jgi:basic membrane lipoprotein Med (substrate-binding protein (PBP1-ABC) superfamily)/DNA-binding SARP family transcriptional activator